MRYRKIKKEIILLAVTIIAITSISSAIASSKNLIISNFPEYQKISGISGNLNSIGSDTLNNISTLWSESFQKIYPNVKIQIEGKGSSTAPPALIEGTAQLGPMSRSMKAEEIDKFESKFGYKPTGIPVAVDAIAVFVNKDNPIKGLTLQQIDSIFSSTYKRDGAPLTKWNQLGLTGIFANKRISVYGRNSASGTYGFFKKSALKGGDYRIDTKEQPGSSSVIQGIANDLYGIGYSGVGYLNASVRALPIAEKIGEPFIEPHYENVINGTYPLARLLKIYINKHPNKPLDPLTLEFLKFALSKQGQEIVAKDGFFPLNQDLVERSLKSLE